VRTFKVYTPDLFELATWLKQYHISTVAMEATGIYWIPLYEILLEQGFEVLVVNPVFVKRMRDTKTDMADSQLLLQLHTYGQLPASFHPTLEISVIQSYWRQRARLIAQAADAVRLMQKALDLMNLHLHKATSDISGVTGLRIIRAIIDGTHDPYILACMKAKRIRCSHDELFRALTGNYRTKHLFSLKLALAQYDFARQQVQECDVATANCLQTLTCVASDQMQMDNESTNQSPSTVRPRRQRIQGNAPKSFDLPREVERLTGRKWDSIPGIGAMTIMTGISEVGLDLTKWPTERHF